MTTQHQDMTPGFTEKKNVRFRDTIEPAVTNNDPPSSSSSPLSNTASNGGGGGGGNGASRTKSGKKVLIVHHHETIKRIAFTERANSEAIERSIRRECGIDQGHPFSLLDGEGDSVVIDGSMDCGEAWLSQEPLKNKKQPTPATKVAARTPDAFWDNINNVEEEQVVHHTFDPVKREWRQRVDHARIDSIHFASGSLRRAYYIELLSEPGIMYVAKISIDPEEDTDTYWQDVEIQMYAKQWAEKFNSYKPPKTVDFLNASVLSFSSRKSGQNICALEKFIYGKYRKHNNNYGYVSEEERNTPQSFSHFTYEASGKKILVCDIQGVSDNYTDPQMHTVDSMPSLGKGNLGSRGINKFLSTHHCNLICQYLRLDPINAKVEDFGTRPDQPMMSYQHIDIVNVDVYGDDHSGVLERQRLLHHNNNNGVNNGDGGGNYRHHHHHHHSHSSNNGLPHFNTSSQDGTHSDNDNDRCCCIIS